MAENFPLAHRDNARAREWPARREARRVRGERPGRCRRRARHWLAAQRRRVWPAGASEDKCAFVRSDAARGRITHRRRRGDQRRRTCAGDAPRRCEVPHAPMLPSGSRPPRAAGIVVLTFGPVRKPHRCVCIADLTWLNLANSHGVRRRHPSRVCRTCPLLTSKSSRRSHWCARHTRRPEGSSKH